jgi:hypothetical protein
MEYVGIFYGRLVQFMTIWYNIWPFGIVCGHLVYTLFLFWYVWAKKNLATLMHSFRNARTVVRLKRKKRVLEFFFHNSSRRSSPSHKNLYLGPML